MIVIGAGNLGQAIANYTNFEKRGFVVKGLFDKNEALFGKKVREIEVLPMTQLKEFIADNNIEIAALTLPKHEAVKVAEEIVGYGIKAIWNFAHTDLQLPKEIVIENVHLSESLMRLSYNLTRNNR